MKKEWWQSKAILAGAALIAISLVEYFTGDSSVVDTLWRVLEGIGFIGLRQAVG